MPPSIPLNRFIEIAIHKNYHYKKHFTILDYNGTDGPVTIFCDIHNIKITHQYASNVYSRPAKICIKCCDIETDEEKYERLTEEFIFNHKRRHGDTYDYTKTKYTGVGKKLCFTCPLHGDNYIRKHADSSCRDCYLILNKEGNSRRDTKEIFINKADLSHNVTNPDDRIFDYSKLEYKGDKELVLIICKKCNIEFKQYPFVHKSGSGCPHCAKQINKSGILTRKTLEQFIIDANKIHCGAFLYNETEYKNNKTSVKIFCTKCQKCFYCSPSNHLAGYGCKNCGGSKGEKIISNILSFHNIRFIREHTFDDLKDVQLLRYDFYLEQYNLLVEYDGKQHFYPVEYFGGEETYKKTVKHDNMKNEYAEIKGYNLLRIRYDEDIKSSLICKLQYLINTYKFGSIEINFDVNTTEIENSIKESEEVSKQVCAAIEAGTYDVE